jgi:hypothetical protein
VVFELIPNSNGSWTESVLYTFCSIANCADGAVPFAGVIFDTSGNLYGTASGGGRNDQDGVVFKLVRGTNGKWTEAVLHLFNGTKGRNPNGLTFDAVGNLYGTTPIGGHIDVNGNTDGVVFKLTRKSGGGWAYSVLHFFFGKPAMNPLGSPLLDDAGNLYGMTSNCGSGAECQGVVFEVTP